jgi:hypothetical protein
MLSRVVSLFLTLILVWAGLVAQERPMVQASFNADQAMALVAEHTTGHTAEGSVDSPPVDEQASQPLVESLGDLPGLIQSCHDVPAPTLTRARPHVYDLAGLPPPYLDGLQRPPRAARASGGLA